MLLKVEDEQTLSVITSLTCCIGRLVAFSNCYTFQHIINIIFFYKILKFFIIYAKTQISVTNLPKNFLCKKNEMKGC